MGREEVGFGQHAEPGDDDNSKKRELFTDLRLRSLVAYGLAYLD